MNYEKGLKFFRQVVGLPEDKPAVTKEDGGISFRCKVLGHKWEPVSGKDRIEGKFTISTYVRKCMRCNKVEETTHTSFL